VTTAESAGLARPAVGKLRVLLMGSETKNDFPHEFFETPNGCLLRWKGPRPRFQFFSLVFCVFCSAIFYVPLVAAGVFLIKHLFQAPWHLLLLSSVFVVQVGLVGPAPLVLRLLYRECRELAWRVVFARLGHHDLEVTREWLYFGERVGPRWDFLNPRASRRVPTQAIQQVIVFVYRGQETPTREEEGKAKQQLSKADSGTSPKAHWADKMEEEFRNQASRITAEGNGELAIVEKPGAEPTPYFSGFPTEFLLDLAEKLHRHLARSQPALPTVALIDKPAAAVRAEWEAQGREARAIVEGTSPVLFWWQRKLWIRAVLLLTSLVGLWALLRLIWHHEVDVRWRLMGFACLFAELFFIVAIFASPAGRQVAQAKRPSNG
jgi:hypothetical protein